MCFVLADGLTEGIEFADREIGDGSPTDNNP